MIRDTAREQGVIMPSHEMFKDAPGYDPLALGGDTLWRPKHVTSSSCLLLSVSQEDWRGGQMSITEFVPPAPDVAMHFSQPIKTRPDGVRYTIADLLAQTSFTAAFSYHEAPDEYPRSGVYYSLPPREGRHNYRLAAGELMVGRPIIYQMPDALLIPLSNETNEHSADAHRVLANTDELAETMDTFGWVLGLEQSDRQKLAQYIGAHVKAARTYRKWHNMGLAIAAQRELRGLN